MKVICEECNWHGFESDILRAPNPFNSRDELSGCPKCRSVECLIEACDEDGCWNNSTCGTPTPNGYRRTCGKHIPK